MSWRPASAPTSPTSPRWPPSTTVSAAAGPEVSVRLVDVGAREQEPAARADRLNDGRRLRVVSVVITDRQPSGVVGRARELAEIERALDQVASGASWALELSGEAGIGKSHLLAEACRRAEGRGFLVLDGRAAEFEQDMPFGVIVDALNDHVASLGPAVLRALDAGTLGELA